MTNALPTKENLVFIGEVFGGVKMFGETGVVDSEASHWEWSVVAWNGQ